MDKSWLWEVLRWGDYFHYSSVTIHPVIECNWLSFAIGLSDSTHPDASRLFHFIWRVALHHPRRMNVHPQIVDESSRINMFAMKRGRQRSILSDSKWWFNPFRAHVIAIESTVDCTGLERSGEWVRLNGCLLLCWLNGQSTNFPVALNESLVNTSIDMICWVDETLLSLHLSITPEALLNWKNLWSNWTHWHSSWIAKRINSLVGCSSQSERKRERRE